MIQMIDRIRKKKSHDSHLKTSIVFVDLCRGKGIKITRTHILGML